MNKSSNLLVTTALVAVGTLAALMPPRPARAQQGFNSGGLNTCSIIYNQNLQAISTCYGYINGTPTFFTQQPTGSNLALQFDNFVGQTGHTPAPISISTSGSVTIAGGISFGGTINVGLPGIQWNLPNPHFTGQTTAQKSLWDEEVPTINGTLGCGTLCARAPEYDITTENYKDTVWMNNGAFTAAHHNFYFFGPSAGGKLDYILDMRQAGPLTPDVTTTSTGGVAQKQSSIGVLNPWLSINDTAGGSVDGLGIIRPFGLAYGGNPKVTLSGQGPGHAGASMWAALVANGEVDLGIDPSQNTITATGSVTIGDTLSIAIGSTVNPGFGTVTVSTIAQSGDTIGLLMQKLCAQIKFNTTLNFNGVGAGCFGATDTLNSQLKISWPLTSLIGTGGSTDVTITPTVTGAGTEVLTLGTAVPGASARLKSAQSIVELKTDGSNGFGNDAAWYFSKQSNGAGWSSGGWRSIWEIGGGGSAAFDDINSQDIEPSSWPMRFDADLIMFVPQTNVSGSPDAPVQAMQLHSVVDARNVDFLTAGGGPVLSPSYQLWGNGDQTIGSGTLSRLTGSASAAGVVLSASGWEGTAVVLVNGGGSNCGTADPTCLQHRYYNGDICPDAVGGLYQVDTTGATGNVLTFHPVVQGSHTGFPSAAAGSVPATNQPVIGCSGTGWVNGITWTAGNTVRIGGTGQTVDIEGTLADHGAVVLDIRALGAVGNGGQYTSTFSIGASSTTLTATSPVFANATPGMFIGVPTAGARGATGSITSLPISTHGSGYTSAPVVTFSGSPTEAATVLPVMGLDAATKTAGGTGCPASTTVTFNVATVTAIVPVQISMATDGSGNATGTPTIVAGQWLNRFPALTGNVAVGSSCSVQPTFSFDVDVDHFCVGNTPGTPVAQMCVASGYGSGYPLVGTTATLTGGSPSVAATPGTPVVTPYVQTLGTTIATVVNSNTITLSAAATTASTPSVVTYGSLDTTAVQNAVNLASATGKGVYVPNSTGCYMIDKVTLPSNVVIDGSGQFCMHPSSLNPMFDASTNSHIRIQNISAIGNLATVKSPSSGSVFLTSSPGASDIKVQNTYLSFWTRHGINVDGVVGFDASHNTINNIWFGAGIIVSSTSLSSQIVMNDNIVSFTQFAGIETGFVGIDGGTVSGNQITWGGNNGYGDSTSGHTSDCLTGYTGNASNENTVVANNILTNCGNNGMHWGGNNVLIANNVIKTPFGAGIFIGAFPNSAPPILNDNRIIGNHITGRDNTDSTATGINVRNLLGGVISGNTVTNTYDGVETYGFTSGTGIRDLSITGNEFNTNAIGVWLRHKTQFSYVGGNIIHIATNGIQISNNAVSGDGSFPSNSNTIGPNVHDSVTTQIVEDTGTNFNQIFPQSVYNGSGAAVTIVGAETFIQPTLLPIPIGSLGSWSAVTYKNACINITGSTTTNIAACSDGTNWRWVKDNTIPTT